MKKMYALKYLLCTLLVVLNRKRFAVVLVSILCLLTVLVGWASITDHFDYQLSCQVMNKSAGCISIERPIFFVELSGRAQLSYRAACAIESAARHHPEWPIILYNRSYIASDKLFSLLINLKNFHLKDLNLEILFNNTPLKNWYQSGIYRKGPYWIEKLSDAIRLVVLWNNGGIYLDTDAIVLRSMSELCNVIGLETLYKVNGAVLVFDKQSPFLKRCMNKFEINFNPFIWGTEGPSLLTETVIKTCNLKSESELYHMVSKDYTCEGLGVLPWHSFYPLPWPMWPKLFSVVYEFQQDLSCSYTLHLWNSMSKEKTTRLGSQQLLDVLAQQNCPNVYNLLKENKIDTF
ncbi:Lactosylceramide 4-alpha-galactosyltransferase [Chamberlinius hualienensis]